MTNRQQRRAAERQSQKLRKAQPPVAPFSDEDLEQLLTRKDGNLDPEMLAHLERVVLEAEAETERLEASLRATSERTPAQATPAKDRSRSTTANLTDTVDARDPGFVLPAKSYEPISPASRAGIGGPKTIQGKARSSMNNLQHGLAGIFFVGKNECQEDYDNLLADLVEEHAPVTTTESILVRKMAEHHWLSRRAQTLTTCYIESGDQDCVSLYMRYHTTHERGFYKALNGLNKLQKERTHEAKQFQKEFVSQKQEQQATEWHEAASAKGRSRAAMSTFVTTADSRDPGSVLPEVSEGVRLVNARARHAETAPKPRRKPETVAENPLGLSPDQMEELFQDILNQVQTESAHVQAA